ITSNEITITLSNKDRKFDAGNTQSPLYEMLKPNRRIKAWLGIERDRGEKEFVPLGIFWSGDWEVTEEGISAKVSGRDRLESLSKSTYEYTGPREDNLYNLALNVLTDAGLTPDEYW
ncbi:hypothetical protein, partial [Stenotrophomonas maltophilia group sp. RNC7]|uniref:hypothetical protein n=1 Tax=Stenotrophomonas maltophilia group sp. RNC7 TaxID=3071467 RepID=UPI0027E15450